MGQVYAIEEAPPPQLFSQVECYTLSGRMSGAETVVYRAEWQAQAQAVAASTGAAGAGSDDGALADSAFSRAGVWGNSGMRQHQPCVRCVGRACV